MNPALLFLVRRSLANRIRSALGRLRNPRYLLPAVVGVAYFAMVVMFKGGGHHNAERDGEPPPIETAIVWAFTALLLLLAATAWLFPGKGRGLVFLESEVAMLFPAPLRRRELVLYKIVATQPGLIFSALLMSVFMGRREGPLRFAAVGVGAYFILNALHLHGIGAAFTQASLASHGRSGWRRQWPVLAVLLAIPLALWYLVPRAGVRDFDGWLAAMDASWAALLLYPVQCLVLLPMSPGPLEFLLNLVPVAAVLALLARWVLRADVAFEEAAAEQAEVLARRIDAVRRGRLTDPSLRPAGARVERAPWRLARAGPAEGAFVWKAATAFARGTSWRTLAIVLLLAVVTMAVVQGVVSGRDGRDFPLVTGVCGGLAVLAVLAGPSLSPAGMRHDLEVVDILKSLPVSGARLLRGEVLGAAAPVVVVQWLLLVVGIAAFPAEVPGRGGGPPREIPLAWLLGAGLAALAVLPAATLLSTTTDAAMAVLFPGWLRPPAGDARPAGTEALGQNILTFLAKSLAMSIGLIVAAACGAVPVVAALLLGPAYLLPAAVAAGGVVAGGIVVAECWLLCSWLGDRYDALDPAEEGIGG